MADMSLFSYFWTALLEGFVFCSCRLPYLRARRTGALHMRAFATITVVVMGNIIHGVSVLKG